MKNFTKIFALAAFVAVLATSCKKDSPYQAGPAENTLSVEYSFAKSSYSAELDPNDPTFTIDIARSKSEGDIKIPVKVVFNEKNAYEVPQYIEFADGQDETSITVNQKGDLGVSYILEIQIPDEYHYLYKQTDPTTSVAIKGYSFKASTQKVSWTKVCAGTYTSCFYTALKQAPFKTELQVCDQVPTRYRFKGFNNPDVNIVFNLYGAAQTDGDTGKTFYNLTVAKQNIGYQYQGVDVFLRDVSTWQGSASYVVNNVFYPEDNKATIWMQYGASGSNLLYNYDSFVADQPE